MDNKLYHIPDIVLGIKLRDVPVKYFSFNMQLQYSKINSDLPGTLVINNKPIDEFISSEINGITLIEEKDSKYAIFDSISDQVNTFKYSYADIKYLDGEVEALDPEILYSLIIDELENILEKHLANYLEAENIFIESLKLV